MTNLPVAFLTDYGEGDEFAGSCRLVIERLARGASVIDVTHGIPPGDVRRGALALEAAAQRAAPAVWLAVVDPGVGTARRGVAVAAGTSFLVGPDNGFLEPAAGALGGVDRLVDISGSPLRSSRSRRRSTAATCSHRWRPISPRAGRSRRRARRAIRRR